MQPAAETQPIDEITSIESLSDWPERSLLEGAAAAARAGTPLKIRTALQIFNPEMKPYGAFKGWRGQAWTITLPGIEPARTFRQTLEVLFDLIRMGGIDQTLSMLQTAAAELSTTDRKVG